MFSFLFLGMFALAQTALLSAKNNTVSFPKFETNISTKNSLLDSAEDWQDLLAPAVFYDILQSLPSDLEYAMTLKKLESNYPNQQLNASENVNNYTSDYKRALNLGIYSADLNYSILYEEHQKTFDYLDAIKKLTDSLNLETFDYLTIKNSIKYNDFDINSRLQLATLSLQHINFEFLEKKKIHLRLLMLIGSWIESNYIASLAYKENENENLRNTLVNQQSAINRLLLCLNVFPNKPNFKSLIEGLEELRKLYQYVEVVEQDGIPILEIINGEIVVTDKKETGINVSSQDTEVIINLIASIRNKIINKSDSPKTEKNKSNTKSPTDSLKNNSDISVKNRIYTILDIAPLSLELATMVREAEDNYYGNQLNDVEQVGNYTTTYQKALNLGVYHTDLEYSTLYEKYQNTNEYLQATEVLADSLDIKNVIDFDMIKKNTQKNKDLDYLLELATLSFIDINEELEKQNRQEVSILLLTGSWLESLYITSMVYKKTRNEKLKNKIGENKLSLNEILLVLNIYKDKPNFDELITELQFLQKKYQEVELVVTDGQPKMEVIDGEIVITDTEKTLATVSDSDLFSIINLISSIRTKIISN